MKKFGLTASVGAIVVASILAGCAGDTPADTLISPSDTALQTGNLSGGGWTPAVAAAASTNDKVTICHSGNGKHYTQINVSAQGARAHLGDPATGKGGHDADYRVSDLTPCPPPSTPGQVQICKVAGVAVANGTNFTFALLADGQTKTVTVAAGAGPRGTCVNANSYPVGTTVEVREAAQQGVATSAIVVSPAGAQQGSSDLANRVATVIVGVGTTTLTFTNDGPHGTLVICKVGDTGITAGTNFTFTAGGRTSTVAAGPAPNGTCGTSLNLAPGPVTVAENGTAGAVVQSITGTPAPTNVSLPNQSATTQITAGQETRITFTNVIATATNSGILTICKIAGTGVTPGTNFTFSAGGQSATVAAGPAPTGTACQALVIGAGNVTVTEAPTAGVNVVAVTSSGTALVSSDLPTRTAVVTITAGQATTVTFTNSTGSAP